MSRPHVTRSRVVAPWAAFVVTTAVLVNVAGEGGQGGSRVEAAVTTTVPVTAAPTTTPAPPTTTAGAIATTAPAVPTTVPGPPPRASRRVPTAVATEKIRATSLPLRTLGITLGGVIAVLAMAGFVYGRIRSRIPAVAIPKAATPAPSGSSARDETSSAPGSTSLPPPPAIPLPPPGVEDAVSDPVIFEPPPSHHSPSVISESPIEDTTDDETA